MMHPAKNSNLVAGSQRSSIDGEAGNGEDLHLMV